MKNKVNRRKFIKQASTGTILAFGMGASAYQSMASLISGHPITITAGHSSGSSGGHPSSSVSVGGGTVL